MVRKTRDAAELHAFRPSLGENLGLVLFLVLDDAALSATERVRSRSEVTNRYNEI
jgi:hypothetical protein